MSNVFPRLAQLNIANRPLVHSVFVSKLLLAYSFASKSVTNLSNVIRCQFRTWVSRACQLTILRDHIGHIVVVSSNPEMVGVDTSAVISAGAVMKHGQPVWDLPMSQFPCDAVSVSGTHRFRYPDSTIAFFTDSACPNPATIGHFDLFPETILQWASLECVLARTRAEFAATALDYGWDLVEGLTAIVTDAFNTVRLVGHRALLSLGVVPSAVDAARGLLHASILPREASKCP